MKVLMPFAQAPDARWLDALLSLQLPHLSRLLAGAQAVRRGVQSPLAWSTACEAAKAELLGWPQNDGAYPWAAFEHGTHEAAAWVQLCHWQMGQSSAQLADPDALQVSAAQSQALMERMAPFFAEDGVHLSFSSQHPDRWWASGEVFKDLRSVSLERLRGQDLGSTWLQEVAQALPARLRRLQSEMQMLLYQEPVNDARANQGLSPINALWFSGCGALDDRYRAPANASHPFQIEAGLQSAALNGDMNHWLEQWRVLDATVLQTLLEQVEVGSDCQWVVTGRDSWQTLAWTPVSGSRRASWLPQWARPGRATLQRQWLLQTEAT